MMFTPQSSDAIINGTTYQLIAFYFPGKNTLWDDYYQAPFLGNFWESNLTVTINNLTASFHTAEAAFQATKWWSHATIRKKFENALTGNDAFRIKKHLTTPADYSYAGLGRDQAMMVVLEAKFKNSSLAAGLLATKDAYLLEHNSSKGRDHYWSDDKDGSGKNKLGKSLMILRQKLGSNGDPYPGAVVNMTDNVQTVVTSAEVGHRGKAKTVLSKTKGGNTTGSIKIIPSVFKGGNKDGDFGWMIVQPQYAKSFFIFNDNVSQFEDHQNDPTGVSGCSVGDGNAVIRPYQCNTPPQAGGIPTGPNFTGLTEEVQAMIDQSIISIKNGINSGGYDSVVYSSNGHGGLGTSIFHVPDDVKNYIVGQINDLANL